MPVVSEGISGRCELCSHGRGIALAKKFTFSMRSRSNVRYAVGTYGKWNSARRSGTRHNTPAQAQGWRSSNPIGLLAQHRFFVEGKNDTKTELKESFWNSRAEFKDTEPEQQARIWGRGIITDKNAGRERVYERFFVGTKTQFADSIRGWTR
jgi:hypothetical protein